MVVVVLAVLVVLMVVTAAVVGMVPESSRLFPVRSRRSFACKNIPTVLLATWLLTTAIFGGTEDLSSSMLIWIATGLAFVSRLPRPKEAKFLVEAL